MTASRGSHLAQGYDGKNKRKPDRKTYKTENRTERVRRSPDTSVEEMEYPVTASGTEVMTEQAPVKEPVSVKEPPPVKESAPAKNSANVKKRKKHIVGKVLLVILALFIAGGIVGLGTVLLITHGPSEQAKILFVRTFKDTGTVQWIPEMFMDDDEVQRLVDPIAVDGGTKYTVERDAAVTEVVIEPVPEDVPVIEIEDISGPSWHGKMVIVRDPSLVTLAIPTPNPNGSYGRFVQVEDYCEMYGAVAGITAGGYNVDNNDPAGFVIKDGKIVDSCPSKIGRVIGFTEDHKLVLGRMSENQAMQRGIVDAICWQPYLIVDGVKRTGLGGGYNPRAAIGQKADGTVILILIEGRMISSLGATFDELADYMEDLGCINAANLDSGRSSIMVYEGKAVTKVAIGAGVQTVNRAVPNAFIVMPEGWSND